MVARDFCLKNRLVPGTVVNRSDKLGFSTPYESFFAKYPQIGMYWLEHLNVDLFSRGVVEKLMQSAWKGDLSVVQRVVRAISISMYLDTNHCHLN